MMFYRPILAETGEMWDTWIYWHEGAYYLYYLAKSGKQWDNISMATSSDGVNWSEIGPILKMNEGVTWMGTGAVWEIARFQCSWQVHPQLFRMERRTPDDLLCQIR